MVLSLIETDRMTTTRYTRNSILLFECNGLNNNNGKTTDIKITERSIPEI